MSAYKIFISSPGDVGRERHLLAERDDLILPRARVAASYERWRAENQAGDFLLPSGKQLSEAEQLLAEYGEELTPELKAYVAASMAQAHAQQKRRQRLLVGALVLFALLALGATAAAFFGFWQKVETEKQKLVAVAAKVEAQAKEKDAITAKGNLEVKNRELETLVQEAARSDLLVAQERLQHGELRPHMNEDTDHARLLRWRLLPPQDRPVDPYGTTTQEQAVDLLIRPEVNVYEAEHAYDLDSWYPLVHLALASFEKDSIRADFLRQYSLDRLPKDPRLCQRAAEFLRKQGKEDLAREVDVRGDK